MMASIVDKFGTKQRSLVLTLFFTRLSKWIIILLLLFLFEGVFFRATALVLYYSACALTFSYNIRQEKCKQLGLSSHDKLDCLFKPIHWFQFVDDAAVVATNESKNQLLWNCFTKWCTWSDMNIRVDKCVTFGIKKFSSRSLQSEHKLFNSNEFSPQSNMVIPSNTLVAISTLKWTTRSTKKSLTPHSLICQLLSIPFQSCLRANYFSTSSTSFQNYLGTLQQQLYQKLG